LIYLSKFTDTPEDIGLWLLAAAPDTGELERDLPLPVAISHSLWHMMQ
jgi:hypothetical protein